MNMCSNIGIRQAAINEQEEIAALVKRCGKHVRDYFGIRNLKDMYLNGHVWIVANDIIIAFAVAVPLKRSPIISLYEIGVDPDYRRQGHAKKLLKHIQKIYPERDYAFVVNESNIEGRAAYNKLGFKVNRYDVTKSGRCIVRMGGKI